MGVPGTVGHHLFLAHRHAIVKGDGTMSIVKTAIGIFQCLLGAVLVVWAFGMAYAERHAFRWLPFLLVVAFGIVIFAGGVLLFRGSQERLSIVNTVMGIALCVVGILFVFFAGAEAISEWHAFFRGGHKGDILLFLLWDVTRGGRIRAWRERQGLRWAVFAIM